MATTNKLLVVHAKDWVVRVQKIRMEDDLNAVRLIVEELNATNLVEDGVVVVVRHVMSGDRR